MKVSKTTGILSITCFVATALSIALQVFNLAVFLGISFVTFGVMSLMALDMND